MKAPRTVLTILALLTALLVPVTAVAKPADVSIKHGDCTITLTAQDDNVTQADMDAVKAAIEKALKDSDDMRTKATDACGKHGKQIRITVKRDDPRELLGSARINSGTPGDMSLDVGDIDRTAGASSGAAADVAQVADQMLADTIAHELDHLRHSATDDHRDPKPPDSRTQTGPAIDDANAVRADLGNKAKQTAYSGVGRDGKGRPIAVLPFDVDGRKVEVRVDDLDEPGRRAPVDPPPEPGGIPHRPCDTPDDTGCYDPVRFEGSDLDSVPEDEDNCPDQTNPEQADSDGDGAGAPCDPDADADGTPDAQESTLGASSQSASSTPESWLQPGSCGDGIDNDRDRLVGAADPSCVPPIPAAGLPVPPIGGDALTAPHLGGGLGPAVDPLRFTGDLVLDSDLDGSADEVVALDGILGIQRIGEFLPGSVTTDTIAFEAAGLSGAFGAIHTTRTLTMAPPHGTVMEDGDELTISLPVPLEIVTDDGTRATVTTPVTVTGTTPVWPPYGIELTGESASNLFAVDAATGSPSSEVVGQVLGLTVRTSSVPAGPSGEVETVRHAGLDRFTTAADIALAAFSSGAATVLIGRADDFPDALAGAYLAGQLGAPILLVRTDEIPQATFDALAALQADTVILLGGEAAISRDVETTLAEGYEVQRIGGSTRYATAADLVQAGETVGTTTIGGATLRTAILATGTNFPDALAAGPYGYAGALPILLTTPGALSSEARTVLADEDLGIERVVVAGGDAAVSEAVEQELLELGLEVIRAAGATRLSTATQLSELLGTGLDLPFDTIVLATARNFPDALAVAPLAAINGGVLVLVDQPSSLGAPTADFLFAHCFTVGTVLVAGGDAVVADAAVAEAEEEATCDAADIDGDGEAEVVQEDANLPGGSAEGRSADEDDDLDTVSVGTKGGGKAAGAVDTDGTTGKEEGEPDQEVVVADPTAAPGTAQEVDLDGDGDSDVITVGTMGGGTVKFEDVDGDGEKEVVIDDPTQQPGQSEARDLDGDGDIDVVWRAPAS